LQSQGLCFSDFYGNVNQYNKNFMIEELKHKLLAKFIENLSFDGWSAKNLSNSAEQLALTEPEFSANQHKAIFANGLQSLTHYFVEQTSKKFNEDINIEQIQKLRFSERVIFLAHARILYYHNLLGAEGFKKFISYCSTANILNSITNIFKTADDIWFFTGDKSTDFSYYTKRLSLSFIYTSSVLYSISDVSENLSETKKFIEARVADILKINKLKQSVKNFAEKYNIFMKPKLRA
jgi:ubiquinone biosynthesis protein COQ9